MAEILTESFCERCGTRYTFQAAAPRRQRLSKFKVLSKGLRKYVLDDSTTLDEAFAEARSDEEREISAHQVEAFHQTFNFCLTCRQYTCANCWNEAEGRCLTCAPNLSPEVLPTAFPTLGTTIAPAPETNGHDVAPPADLAWPTVDLRRPEDEAAEEAVAERPATDEPAAPEAAIANDVGEEALDAAIAARLDALTSPATGSAALETAEATETQALEPPEALEAETPETIEAEASERIEAVAPETIEAVAPETIEAVAPETTEITAVAEDESVVPPDVLAAVRAKEAAERAALAAPEPAAPEPAAPEPPPVPADADPAERAAAAAARTAWLLSQLRPATAEEPAVGASAAEEAAEVGSVVEAAAPAVEEPVPAVEEAQLPRDDRVGTPTWSVVAPVEPEPAEAAAPPAQPAAPPETAVPPQPVIPTAPAQPGAPTVPAQPGAPTDVRWPTPAWPSSPEPTPIWARPAADRTSWPRPEPVNLAPAAGGGASGLWAESSREVLSRSGGVAATGVQACINCGLPLSATARFCRRCGSAQTTA